MGHTPIVHAVFVPLDAQIRALEPRLRWRYRRTDGTLMLRGLVMPWRRRAAYRACAAIIRLRLHALYGEGDVSHAGPCARPECGNLAPPRKPSGAAKAIDDLSRSMAQLGTAMGGPPVPLKPAEPTFRER